MKNKIKLKKGDEVIVLSGKDKGKTGKIVRVIPDVRKVIVTDVNKYKKHQKPGNNEPGLFLIWRLRPQPTPSYQDQQVIPLLL